jgi:hypothetical protein
MSIAGADLDAARRQLERVLASAGFVRNERMGRFLKFIAERHLEGDDSQLKGSVIAVEVFGRKPDHDPAQDSIVPTEASRLRARLAEYYLGARARATHSSLSCRRADTLPPFAIAKCRLKRLHLRNQPASGLGCLLKRRWRLPRGTGLVADPARNRAHRHCGSSAGESQPRFRHRLLRRRADG